MLETFTLKYFSGNFVFLNSWAVLLKDITSSEKNLKTNQHLLMKRIARILFNSPWCFSDLCWFLPNRLLWNAGWLTPVWLTPFVLAIQLMRVLEVWLYCWIAAAILITEMPFSKLNTWAEVASRFCGELHGFDYFSTCDTNFSQHPQLNMSKVLNMVISIRETSSWNISSSFVIIPQEIWTDLELIEGYLWRIEIIVLCVQLCMCPCSCWVVLWPLHSSSGYQWGFLWSKAVRHYLTFWWQKNEARRKLINQHCNIPEELT